MPQWAGSSWYFLKISRSAQHECLRRSKDKLDLLGTWSTGTTAGWNTSPGTLIYSRFWNLFLQRSSDWFRTAEPYKKRTAQGLILGMDGEKMSKSQGQRRQSDGHRRRIRRGHASAPSSCSSAIMKWRRRGTNTGAKGCRRFLDKIWRLQEKLVDRAEYSAVDVQPIDAQDDQGRQRRLRSVEIQYGDRENDDSRQRIDRVSIP
ncbi:MAG: hypothetical protein MZU97_19245 [Bacillus subtilis]|nr:hypothetical protein [Bacillus subtilis]